MLNEIYLLHSVTHLEHYYRLFLSTNSSASDIYIFCENQDNSTIAELLQIVSLQMKRTQNST